MHQIALFFLFFGGGGDARYPLEQVSIHIFTGQHTRSLSFTSRYFIKTSMNAYQIYTYLMELKLNTLIWLRAIVKRL